MDQKIAAYRVHLTTDRVRWSASKCVCGVGVIEGQECLITGSTDHEKEADSHEVHAPTTTVRWLSSLNGLSVIGPHSFPYRIVMISLETLGQFGLDLWNDGGAFVNHCRV